MRLVLLLVACVALTGCRKNKPSNEVPGDAEALTASKESSSSLGDAGSRVRLSPPPPVRPREAGANRGAPPPALPLASDALEVVAIGKTWTSKILWLDPIGDRIWLSARNLDAFAVGDGPLVKGPDLLAKLPYTPGKHSMEVVGGWPRLYALRTKNVNGRMESPEPTLFVYEAPPGAGPGTAGAPEPGPGTWKEAKPLGIGWFPHAFVGYRDGALVVTSQVQLNAMPDYSPREAGTTALYLAPDGTIQDAKLGLERNFLAWSASGSQDSVALIGTMAQTPTDPEGLGFASGLFLVRVTPSGMKRVKIRLTEENPLWQDFYALHPIERGDVALVPPPRMTMDEAWKPSNLAGLLVDGSGKITLRTIAGTEDCHLEKLALAGDVVYAIRQCFGPPDTNEVVRVGPDGKTEKLALPMVVKSEAGGFRVAKTDAEKKKGQICAARSLAVRGVDDLWVVGECGGAVDAWRNSAAIPIVLRRGRPQEPLQIP